MVEETEMEEAVRASDSLFQSSLKALSKLKNRAFQVAEPLLPDAQSLVPPEALSGVQVRKPSDRAQAFQLSLMLTIDMTYNL